MPRWLLQRTRYDAIVVGVAAHSRQDMELQREVEKLSDNGVEFEACILRGEGLHLRIVCVRSGHRYVFVGTDWLCGLGIDCLFVSIDCLCGLDIDCPFCPGGPSGIGRGWIA